MICNASAAVLLSLYSDFPEFVNVVLDPEFTDDEPPVLVKAKDQLP